MPFYSKMKQKIIKAKEFYNECRINSDTISCLLEILTKVLESPFFEVKWMDQYSVIARNCVPPGTNFPYSIEFWGADKYTHIFGTTPYITEDDLEEFRRCKSVCIVIKDYEKIAASTWMIRGRHYVRELGCTLEITKNEYYSCRSYVNLEYRGKRLLGYMMCAFAKQYAEPNDKIWGFISQRNTASKRACCHIGWRYERTLGVANIFGIKKIFYMKFRKKGKSDSRQSCSTKSNILIF